MKAKKKIDSKAFASQKRTRRKFITFFRVLRYGLDSFLRNSWLSVAATVVMTITLLIIFTTFASQNILTDTVKDLSNKVDMSIYLKTETTDETAAKITTDLKKLSSVVSVAYISAAQARDDIAKKNSDNADVLAAISEATNKNPATLRVVIKDINNTSELEDFVKTNKTVKDSLNPDYAPSFAGERRNTIKSIGRVVGFVSKVGVAVGILFVAISALIIFNTIRMAIFNRKEEIQMMKLIGADKSFIRGPFLIEAMIYGLIAALAATGLGIWGLYSISGTLTSYQVNVQPTIKLVSLYAGFTLMAMIGIGALIGAISSMLATRRHLKL